MSTLHASTFEYLMPTEEQRAQMSRARSAVKDLAEALDFLLPAGADKTYTLRKVREIGMWANVAITRQADGTPRVDEEVPA